MKVLITTQPFKDNEFLNELHKRGHEIILNNSGQKYSQDQVDSILKLENPDILIAGTEKYGSEQFFLCPNLKMISRVGIGVDSIDLNECAKRNITVANTPEIHGPIVAEFILAQLLDGLRRITISHNDISNKNWNRVPGKSLRECTIGIVGFGRVGFALHRLLSQLGVNGIYISDPYSPAFDNASLEKLLAGSDAIIIAAPLTRKTKHMINRDNFPYLKKDAVIINSSRGTIIDEAALKEWLILNPKGTAFIDVFETEPYLGELISVKNAILTPHAAGSTKTAREDMELAASAAAKAFVEGTPLEFEVRHE